MILCLWCDIEWNPFLLKDFTCFYILGMGKLNFSGIKAEVFECMNPLEIDTNISEDSGSSIPWGPII